MENPMVIDCEFLSRPRSACAFLLKSSKQEYLFVETNTNSAVPLLLERLRVENIAVEQIKYVIVTHIHLDHSGGAGALMQHLPHATLLCHPNAERHLVNPAKLIQSAKQVWGEELYTQLYGEILPISKARIQTMQDGERLTWGDHYLEFFHTRGHANHHFCVYDLWTNGVFTGDAFGALYPDLQLFPDPNRMHIHPITTPTEFDATEAKQSIARILSFTPEKLYLTHFGVLMGMAKIDQAAKQLVGQLNYCRQLQGFVSELATGEEMAFMCEAMLRKYYERLIQGHTNPKLAWEILDGEVRLNAQGITHAAIKLKFPDGFL
ncbi:hypothetical protein BASA81_000401 [Batrachochytrium salamandrivorans]|nr:hypothetical protein BASA81_000401 [Batrachochytrium salamandrivorans]